MARGPLMPRLTLLSSTLLELLPWPTPTTPSPPLLSPPTPSPWPPFTRPPPTVSPPPMLDSSTLPTLESASTTLVSRSPAKQYNNFLDWQLALLYEFPHLLAEMRRLCIVHGVRAPAE